jgi:hypothetical protein
MHIMRLEAGIDTLTPRAGRKSVRQCQSKLDGHENVLLRRGFSGGQLTPLGKSRRAVEFEYFASDEMAL